MKYESLCYDAGVWKGSNLYPDSTISVRVLISGGILGIIMKAINLDLYPVVKMIAKTYQVPIKIRNELNLGLLIKKSCPRSVAKASKNATVGEIFISEG